MSRVSARSSRILRNVAIGAGVTAAAALANYLVGRASEHKRPPPGRFVEAGGVRLHYIEAKPLKPTGPAILLLHGNGAMAEDFAISGLFGRLAKTHRVVAIDRPGFGYSTRPRLGLWNTAAQARLLLSAMRSLGLQRPVVVGHSWSAAVAVEMALQAPAEVSGIGLISGYYFATARADAALLSAPAIPAVGDLIRYTISPVLGWLTHRQVYKTLFSPSPVPQSFNRRFPTGLALRPWQLRAQAADTAYMVPDAARLSRRYGQLTLPLLIVGGAEDRIVNFDRHSLRLAQALPQAELLRLPGGHMIHHIAAAEIAEAIGRLAVRSATAQPAVVLKHTGPVPRPLRRLFPRPTSSPAKSGRDRPRPG